jgi:hypothetical protein
MSNTQAVETGTPGIESLWIERCHQGAAVFIEAEQLFNAPLGGVKACLGVARQANALLEERQGFLQG